MDLNRFRPLPTLKEVPMPYPRLKPEHEAFTIPSHIVLMRILLAGMNRQAGPYSR